MPKSSGARVRPRHELRGAVDREIGKLVGPTVHLDKSVLRRRALRQCRRGEVRGEYVRVAVSAEGRVVGVWVVPGAGCQLDHAGTDGIRDLQASQAGAALVVDADDVAVLESPRVRIVWVHAGRFAALDLAGLTGGSDVELTVKPSLGLVGDQMEWELVIGLAEPLSRFEPYGMTGAVVVPERFDLF